VEPIVHFVLPLAALLLLGVSLRRAVPLAMLGLLPDLDSVFLIHRSFSHSIVVIGLLFIPVFLLIRCLQPVHQGTVVLAFLVLASHVVLDLGSLTPVFWPFYPFDVSLRFSLNLVVGNGVGFSPSLSVVQAPTDFSRMPGLDYPLFTEEGLFLSVVLLIPVLFRILKRGFTGINSPDTNS
jgi:membrane-bound metal-dependent hydrolase YbcI (DUF457 family)